jgi:hypothetical protein
MADKEVRNAQRRARNRNCGKKKNVRASWYSMASRATNLQEKKNKRKKENRSVARVNNVKQRKGDVSADYVYSNPLARLAPYILQF